MHFVTICDSDDSSSSDSDMSNDNVGSFVVGSLSDECVDTAAADAASLPAVGTPPADSVASSGGLSVQSLSGTSAEEHCRVRHSPVLCNAEKGSPTTSAARSGHGSSIQPAIAEGQCQHICESCCCHY